MAKLKLGAIADDKSVKLTVELPAAVHRALLAYAEVLARETGQGMIFPEGDADPDPTDSPPAAPTTGKSSTASPKRPKLQVVK